MSGFVLSSLLIGILTIPLSDYKLKYCTDVWKTLLDKSFCFVSESNELLSGNE